MNAIPACAEVDAARTLRLAVPCDLPPGPVDVVVQLPESDNEEGLPPDLAEQVASLAVLTDEELWRAARTRLADEAADRLSELNDLRQRAGLSAAEAAEAAALLRQYERAILIRAKAAGILYSRGHDISVLLKP
jgi:hypothetical protein